MAENTTPQRPTSARIYLDVPYSEKDQAKALGARWDNTARRWFDPHPPTPALARWTALPDIPEVIPGEDRSFGSGLFVDLVPRTCWFTNVRSCISEQDWERLRRPVVHRAQHCCEICTAPEDRAAGQWLDVHERWLYDERTRVQQLRRLIVLCKPCHLVTHFGYANVTGRTGDALAHLKAVRGMSHQQAIDHIRAAENRWIERSRRRWELDLSILDGLGITAHPPQSAAGRAVTAERQIQHSRSGGRR